MNRCHVVFEARNCANELITNKGLIKKALIDLSSLCEMKILHGPVITKGMPVNPGLTGFVIVDYSHISIHSFSKTNELSIDVFSCKEFNKEIVIDYVIKAFKLKNVKVIEVKR